MNEWLFQKHNDIFKFHLDTVFNTTRTIHKHLCGRSEDSTLSILVTRMLT